MLSVLINVCSMFAVTIDQVTVRMIKGRWGCCKRGRGQGSAPSGCRDIETQLETDLDHSSALTHATLIIQNFVTQ
jgi:hypothetical protein